MALLSLSSVSCSYPDAHPVLTDVDLDLGQGWHGLVGPNGSGKTTLLAVMSGDLTPRLRSSWWTSRPTIALVVVSHDDTFAERITNETLHLS